MDVLTAANNMRVNGRKEAVLIKTGHFFSLGGYRELCVNSYMLVAVLINGQSCVERMFVKESKP